MAEIESICVIPSTYGHDQIWLTVKRTINGNEVRYIELINEDEWGWMGKLPTPVITADEDWMCTITDAIARASIYYTLDGSNPDEYAKLYTGQFDLNLDPGDSVTVRAIAMNEYYLDSDIATEIYTYDISVFYLLNCGKEAGKVERDLSEATLTLATDAYGWGCCVDGNNFFTCEVGSDKITKRSKEDLSKIIDVSIEVGYEYSVCTDSGGYLWCGGTSGVKILNKSDLSTVTTGAGRVNHAIDLAVDDDHLYIADRWGYRIMKYDKNTLDFVLTYGHPRWWAYATLGLDISGDHLYVCSRNQLLKVNKSTWEIVDVAGDAAEYLEDPTEGWINDPYSVCCTGGYAYVSADIGIIKLNESDLSYVDHLEATTDESVAGTIKYNWQIATDGSYLYVCDEVGIVSKWTLSLVFVCENGDRTFEEYDGENAYYFPYGIAVDDTYVYVLDQGDALRVIKRLKSDLSYVGEYRDELWEYFGNPQQITADGTYVYVSDPSTGYVTRIQSSDMTYVDYTDVSTYVDEPEGMVIDGSYIYISSYDAVTTRAVSKFTFPGFVYVSSSPEETNYYDSDTFMDQPYGITVDEDYAYVADSTSGRISRHDKDTLDYVDEFVVSSGYPIYPAVDDTYIYTVIRAGEGCGELIKKYLKVPPFTEIASLDVNDIISIDIAGLYQIGRWE